MEIALTDYCHYDLIEITGRIDSYSAPQIEKVLDGLMDEHHYNLIVDLQHASYISSSGILTFVKAQRALRQQNNGEIVFVNVPSLIFSNFELAGFNTVFNFFDDFVSASGKF